MSELLETSKSYETYLKNNPRFAQGFAAGRKGMKQDPQGRAATPIDLETVYLLGLDAFKREGYSNPLTIPDPYKAEIYKKAGQRLFGQLALQNYPDFELGISYTSFLLRTHVMKRCG